MSAEDETQEQAAEEVLPSFADLAAEDTGTTLQHEHEAVDRVEEAAAQQSPSLEDESSVARPEGPDDVEVFDAVSMVIRGGPVTGTEPPRS